jgi:hypothetical protein
MLERLGTAWRLQQDSGVVVATALYRRAVKGGHQLGGASIRLRRTGGYNACLA